MKTFTIEAEIKLMSLNQAFVALRNGRRVRSKQYVKFASEISELMKPLKTSYKAFEAHFEPKKHEIHATLLYYTPDLYTKLKTISKNSMDLGNCEKTLVDNIMIGKIDDSCIVNWSMKKLYAPKYSFSLTLEIVDR